MSVADTVLIALGAAAVTIGAITLVAVLLTLRLALRSDRREGEREQREQEKRETLRIVHLHGRIGAVDLEGTPDGFTRCRLPVLQVTSHPVRSIGYQNKAGFAHVPHSAIREVDERDRCPECWKPLTVIGPPLTP